MKQKNGNDMQHYRAGVIDNITQIVINIGCNIICS